MEHDLSLMDLAERFPDRESAAEYLESIRWPDGPACPRCGTDRKAYRVKVKGDRRRVWKCPACRKPFSVTVGTIFEASHIGLHKWLIAFHLLCASKKGMSSHQLSRMLGITVKSAWFMTQRIRYAMAQEPFTRLTGVVEVDEAFIGGKPRAGQVRNKKEARMWAERKAPVVSLVQRGGDVRSQHMPRVTGANLRKAIHDNVDPDARLMTDGRRAYRTIGKGFRSHEVVDHRSGEYVRGDVTTNTVEGFFAFLKRGVIGTYHHVSEYHLHRYLAEFDFRYNRRKMTDGSRTVAALEATEGKRLMWADSSSLGRLRG